MKASSLYTLLTMGWLAASCSPPPTPASVVLNLHHVVGERDLVFTQPLPTPYGNTLRYRDVAYVISDVRLLKGNAERALGEGPYPVRVNPHTGRGEVVLSADAVGTWDGIVFHLGTTASAADAAAASLPDSLRGTPSTGTVFLWAEGEFESATGQGEFAVSVAHAPHYKRLRAPLKVPLLVMERSVTEVSVRVDLGRLFAGVDLGRTPMIDASAELDSLSGKVAGNWSRLFSVESAGEWVRMVPTSPPPPDREVRDPSWDTTAPDLTEPLVHLGSALEHCAAGSEAQCFSPFMATGARPGLFHLRTAPGAAVMASGAGVVEEVRFVEHSHLTHTDLVNVRVRPKRDSVFVVEYGNLRGAEVSRGDWVSAGQLLGRAGEVGDGSTSAVTFGVWREQHLTQRLCPELFMSEGLRREWEAVVTADAPAGAERWYAPLCEVPSLACAEAPCESAVDFVGSGGDVDGGRAVYFGACAGCHGARGEGGIASALRVGFSGACDDCESHATLAERIEEDMPPEGYCDLRCAADVAAFINWEFQGP